VEEQRVTWGRERGRRALQRLAEMPNGWRASGPGSVARSVLLLAMLGALLWAGNWLADPRRASGDTFWYGRQALQFAGFSKESATITAAHFIVAQGRGSDAQEWIEASETVDPRYPAIFESRPFYPLTAVPFLPFVGLWAMAVSALVAGTVFAIVFGSLAWWATGSIRVAVFGVTVAYLLPSGHPFAVMQADGWMLALWASGLFAAGLYLTNGQMRWLVGFVVVLVLLYGTKSANAAVLAGAVALVGGGAGLLGRDEGRRRGLALAALALVTGIGLLAAFAALGLPGIRETLQDLLTDHFQRPDVATPVRRLMGTLGRRGPALIGALLPNPLVPIAIVLGLAPLLLIRRAWAALWAVGGLATLSTVVIHPVVSEVPRLIAPLWLAVALGAVLGAAALLEVPPQLRRERDRLSLPREPPTGPESP
jgi:hypothetical protein